MGIAVSVGLAGGLKFVHDEYGDLKEEIKDVRKEMKEEMNGVKKNMDMILQKMSEPRKSVP